MSGSNGKNHTANQRERPQNQHLTPWPKGVSGNPSGRPSAGASVREWWNQMRDWSTEKIEAVANDPSVPVAKRAAAQQWLKAAKQGSDASCDRIIDYTEGRPTQNVKLNGEMDLRHQHDVRPVFDRLRSDPEALNAAKQLADRLRDASAN